MAYTSSDNMNQSDEQFGQGKTTKAIVIDIGVGRPADKQDGRVKCRLFEEINTTITDEQCPWIPVRQDPKSAGMRGVGTFPGHRLAVGSVVHVEYDNKGGHYEIVGTIHNAEMGDKEKQDMNPVATETSPLKMINEQIQQNAKEYLQKVIFNGKNIYDYKGTQDALKFLNGQIPTKYREQVGDAVESVTKHILAPTKLGGARGYKSRTDPKTPKTAGARPHNAGDVRDPIKWLQSNYGKAAELINKEFQMATSLKQSAKSGILGTNQTLVGGAQNLMQAIMSVMQIAQTANSGKTKPEEKKEEEISELEAFLRELYKATTGQEPLDENGKETPLYVQWKAELVATMNREV